MATMPISQFLSFPTFVQNCLILYHIFIKIDAGSISLVLSRRLIPNRNILHMNRPVHTIHESTASTKIGFDEPIKYASQI